jgi:gliding motility-associated-like protein
LSTGNPTSWFWDFGNGNTSILQNPTSFYVTPGAYTVKLVASNISGSDTLIKPYYIRAYSSPESKFNTKDTAGCAPFKVNFTDASVPQSSVITSWFWNFGDGSYSTSQNPTHTYDSAGNYTVYLIVKDANGCQNFFFINNYIKVHKPKAHFNDSIVGCAPPANVIFIDSSSGDKLSYRWNFGDGTISIAVNPTHIYNTADTFKVNLIVTDNIGCRDTFPKDLIVKNYKTDFIYDVNCDTVAPFFIVNFHDLSTPSPSSWNWSFSDGFNSNIQNPSHDYYLKTPFTITLISTIGNGCMDTTTKVYIPPKANFTADSISCSSPFQVNFINTSTGTNISSYFWVFGDGDSSVVQNPVHIYSVASSVKFKNFNVKLIVTNNFGCTDTITKVISIVRTIAKFEATPTEGCIPLQVQFTDKSISIEAINFRLWNFGDGTTSNLPTPTHIYTDTGKYSVTLIIKTINGCNDTLAISDYIKAGIKPDFIDFTITPAGNCFNSVFSVDTLCFHNWYQSWDLSGFNDTSIHTNNWFWSFVYIPYLKLKLMDSSKVQNPVFNTGHIPMGLDTIFFVAGFNGCNDTIYKRIWNVKPRSGICHLRPDSSEGSTTDMAACYPPVKLGFYDCSIGADTTVDFKMTDLQTGINTILNPLDTTFINFTKAGRYGFNIITRNFTSKTGGCGDCNPDYMLVIDSVVNGFTPTADTTCQGITFYFKDTSISFYGEIKQYYWEFGDGDTLVNDKVQYSIYYDFLDYIPGINEIIFPYRVTGTDTIIYPKHNHDGNHNGRTKGTYRNPIHTYKDIGTYIVKRILKVNVYYLCCGDLKNDTLVCTYVSTDTIKIVSKAGIKGGFTVSNTTACPGAPVFFTDTTISDYTVTKWRWDFGDGSPFDTVQNPVHSYSISGNYSVTLYVKNIFGCEDTVIKKQLIHIRPLANFSIQNSNLCYGDSLFFMNSSSGYKLTYSWNFGDGTTSSVLNPKHKYNSIGTYTVSLTVTDSSGCSHKKTMSNILMKQKPTANFNGNPVSTDCPPLAVIFFDLSSSDVNQWHWDFGDGNFSNQQNAAHLFITSGNFDVKLIVSNNEGCSDSLIKNTFVKVGGPVGNLSFNPDSICNPDTVLFAANTKNTIDYFWDFGDGSVVYRSSSSNKDSIIHFYSKPGTYTPSLLLRDSLGCTYIVPKTEKIYLENIIAGFNLDDTVFCNTGNMALINTTTHIFPDSYTWNFGDGNTSIVVSPTHSFSNQGKYNISLYALSDIGCLSTITKTIKVNKAPVIILSPEDTAGCIPFSLTFSGNNSDTSVYVNSWLWNFGDGHNGTGNITTHTFINQGSYMVNLNVIYANNICTKNNIIHINAFKWPVSDFTFNPINPSLTNPAIIFRNISSYGNRWLWYFGNGDSSILKNPIYTYKTSGTYTITLITFNSSGCSDTIRKTIYVSSEDFIKVPEAFSPNGDGRNDKFRILYSGVIQSLEFRIFNRWGEMVFETNDINTGWDGTYKGKPQEEGTYSYYILAKMISSTTPKLLKGNVTLVR